MTTFLRFSLIWPAQFADVRRIGAFAVVHRVDGGFGDHHLAEARLRDAVDLQPVAEVS
jgi:hypothetical protein